MKLLTTTSQSGRSKSGTTSHSQMSGCRYRWTMACDILSDIGASSYQSSPALRVRSWPASQIQSPVAMPEKAIRRKKRPSDLKAIISSAGYDGLKNIYRVSLLPAAGHQEILVRLPLVKWSFKYRGSALAGLEGWPSGLRRTTGNRVHRKVSGVRIPLPPPDFLNYLLIKLDNHK